MGAACPFCPGEPSSPVVESKSSPAAAASDGGDVFDDMLERPQLPPDEELEKSPYISKEMLGPPCCLLGDTQPNWEFELSPGKWKSYSLEESIELDRYWAIYNEVKRKGLAGPCKAKVILMKREGVVNFSTQTCQVGTGRPRSLRRGDTKSDWLSNTYFIEAFTAALSSAGVDVESAAEDMFDFKFNQDFRSVKDDGRKLFRGGQPYELPVGWKRFAVNVKRKYDQGNNSWLKEDDTGWAVAYHGTTKESLPGILCTGFNVGSRQKFAKDTGAGVYCTPWLGVAQHYSKPQLHKGHSVQIVLQLRVRPSAIRQITDKKATDFEKKYWVINNPEDIRAYGVLIRTFNLREWVPPEVMVYGRELPEIRALLEKLQREVEAHERALEEEEARERALEA